MGLLIMAVLFVAVMEIVMGLMKGVAFPGVNGTDKNSLVKGAIVTDDDRFYELVQALITDIAGAEEILSFDRMAKEEALDSLRDGELGLVIVVPDEFYDRAQAMEQTELSVYLPGVPSGAEEKLLAMLAGAQMLVKITDTQIMSMCEGIDEYGLKIDRHKVEEHIFLDAVGRYSDRSELFRVESVSAYGKYDPVMFYTTTLVMICVIAGSVSLMGLYDGEAVYIQKIYDRGRGAFIADAAIRTAAIWITLGTAIEIICVLLKLYLIKCDYLIALDLRLHICVWVSAMSYALWINLVGTILTSDNTHFRVVYILSGLLLMTASGVIVPAVYLPDILRKLAMANPVSALHGMLMSGMWESRRIRGVWDVQGLAVSLVTDVILFAVSVYICGRRRRAL